MKGKFRTLYLRDRKVSNSEELNSLLSNYTQNEKTIIKHGYDAFFETPLHDYLQKNKIKSLYVCGLLTGVCVLNTVFSGFNHGYQINVIGNCCSDRTKDRHQRTLKNYKDYLFRLTNI